MESHRGGMDLRAAFLTRPVVSSVKANSVRSLGVTRCLGSSELEDFLKVTPSCQMVDHGTSTKRSMRCHQPSGQRPFVNVLPIEALNDVCEAGEHIIVVGKLEQRIGVGAVGGAKSEESTTFTTLGDRLSGDVPQHL